MGLVGLANTIAIEGAKYNVHCNVIVPTAASRLTEDIFPPDLFEELKPDLIAPVVAYLCHDSCHENATIIDSAAGWAGKCHVVRSQGALLRKQIGEGISLENVRDNWSRVTDMRSGNVSRLNSTQEATLSLVNALETLRQGGGGGGRASSSDAFPFTSKDLILYALGGESQKLYKYVIISLLAKYSFVFLTIEQCAAYCS